jgi:hypothetical protein
LEQPQVGWIAALPWNQAPAELRERLLEHLPVRNSDQPGVHAADEKMLVLSGGDGCPQAAVGISKRCMTAM